MVIVIKKKKVKRSKGLIIVGVVGGILGFFIAMVSDSFQLQGFMMLPFYINALIIIFTFFISVTLHEFGHVLSFVRNKIKIRAVFFTIFALIKEDNRWKFKITSMKNIGGIAIPDIISIKDDKEFQIKQKAFAKAVIMGPITSVIAWIILTIVSVIIINITSNPYLRSVLLTFILSMVVMTVFIIGTSFIKRDMMIGDFPAYKIIKEDRFFNALQFYNYGYLSSQPEKARNENTYLRQCIIKELEEKYENKDSHWYTLSILDTIIVEYLAGFLDKLPTVVDNYVQYIIGSPGILSKIKSSIMVEILYFHLVILLHRDEATREKSFKLYENLKHSIEPNTAKRKYLFKQVEQVLGIEDNKAYLMNKQNIVTSDVHQIYKYFYGTYMDEIKINKYI